MAPAFATIPEWCKISGIGRTSTYYLISAGSLRAVKAGKRTLIDVEAGLAWLRSLPPADINCSPKKAA